MNENLKLTDVSEFKKRFVYKLESGDDIYSLAKRFHTTVTAIIADNALTSSPEKGELIVIEKIDGEEYIVKPTDDINTISGGDGGRAFEILRKNKTDVIYPGQTLYL